MKKITINEAHIIGNDDIQPVIMSIAGSVEQMHTELPAWVPVRPDTPKDQTLCATRSFLERSGMLGKTEEAALKGFIGILDTGRAFDPSVLNLRFTDDVRQRHTLITGKTGAGKTNKVLLPMIWADLCCCEKSLVVFDVKGDLTGPVVEMAIRARSEKRPNPLCQLR